MRSFSFALAFLFTGASILLSTTASALITVGALDTPGSAIGVEVVGDLAYVANCWSGLRIIDVSNPALPGGGSAPSTRQTVCETSRW